MSKRESVIKEEGKKGMDEWVFTNSSKSINPTGDGNASEFNASVVAEMVAVLSDQIVGVSFVFLCKFLHHYPYLPWCHLRPPNQNRFPKRESIALLWFTFENSSCRILVSSECILHTMNCQAKSNQTSNPPPISTYISALISRTTFYFILNLKTLQ